MTKGFQKPSATGYVNAIPIDKLKITKQISIYRYQPINPKTPEDIKLNAKQRHGQSLTWKDDDTDQLFVTEVVYGVRVSDKVRKYL